MILYVTRVWVDYLNGVKNRETDTLDAGIFEYTVGMGDLIFLEILQGIRDDRQYRLTKQTLLTLVHMEMFGELMSDKCADNYRVLHKDGIAIRKIIDVIIATFCIER
jgi:predicted nucleic acid-binding protein